MTTVLEEPEAALAETDYHAFNRLVWKRFCADPELARQEFRVESNKYGQAVRPPPPAPSHGNRQSDIVFHLRTHLDGGKVLTECPISTREGVRAADVAWCSDAVWDSLGDDLCFVRSPEICVEVLSPSNTRSEISDKRQLYFEEGAKEFWLCDLGGQMHFYDSADGPELKSSPLCPQFPGSV